MLYISLYKQIFHYICLQGDPKRWLLSQWCLVHDEVIKKRRLFVTKKFTSIKKKNDFDIYFITYNPDSLKMEWQLMPDCIFSRWLQCWLVITIKKLITVNLKLPIFVTLLQIALKNCEFKLTLENIFHVCLHGLQLILTSEHLKI